MAGGPCWGLVRWALEFSMRWWRSTGNRRRQVLLLHNWAALTARGKKKSCWQRVFESLGWCSMRLPIFGFIAELTGDDQRSCASGPHQRLMNEGCLWKCLWFTNHSVWKAVFNLFVIANTATPLYDIPKLYIKQIHSQMNCLLHLAHFKPLTFMQHNNRCLQVSYPLMEKCFVFISTNYYHSLSLS